MTEPTVTMTLTQFKEMESAQNTLLALESNVKYFVYKDWRNHYFVNSEDQASIHLIEEMDRLKKDMEHTMQRNRELRDGKK